MKNGSNWCGSRHSPSQRPRPHSPATSEQLWDAIYRIGSEDGTADKISPVVIAKLIELKMVELGATGVPQLTTYGEKCYVVMESGDGVVPERIDMAAMELEQLWPNETALTS